MPKESISLLELSREIKETIGFRFGGSIWVRAEIAELRENHNGHCYLDLIEKKEGTDSIAARVRAIIWSSSYRMIKPYFETATGRTLSDGLKVLVQVAVEYQELYGLSLIIRDIDPTFTLGDLERRKRDIILRLQHENILDMNKELQFPLVPQRIAVISSPTAAGYGDFVNQLDNNSCGIKFYYQLFPAIMQGEQASKSIIEAFDKIYEQTDLFDAVVLIRGGGASVDLICFDDYWLAAHIAQFSLPVITGIGHERDTTIADLVAHTPLKTPTAVAEFLISEAAAFLNRINHYYERIENILTNKLEKQRQLIQSLYVQFTSTVGLILQNEKNRVETIEKQLPVNIKHLFFNRKSKLNSLADKIINVSYTRILSNRNDLDSKAEKIRLMTLLLIQNKHEQLNHFEKKAQQSDPVEILKRGYTLTLLNRKPVKSTTELQKGDEIETIFKDGTTMSRVEYRITNRKFME